VRRSQFLFPIENQAVKPMKTILLATLALSFLGIHAWAQEAYYGEIRTYAFDFCPRGEASLNGQLLSISQNQALFSLLGTRYGGDGRVTFALPTAKPIRTVTGAPLLQCITLEGIYPARD
jgi:microcystin-dependent protein